MPRPLPTPGNFTFKPVPRAAGLRPRREEAVSELVLESRRFLELGRLLLRLLPWLVSRRGLCRSSVPCFGAGPLATAGGRRLLVVLTCSLRGPAFDCAGIGWRGRSALGLLPSAGPSIY